MPSPRIYHRLEKAYKTVMALTAGLSAWQVPVVTVESPAL